MMRSALILVGAGAVFSCTASAFYFTGGPIKDIQGNPLRGVISTVTAALAEVAEGERAGADQNRSRELNYLAELWGKEASVDLRAPLTDQETQYRADLDRQMEQALQRQPSLAPMVEVLRRQSDSYRKLRLFYARQSAHVEQSKQPMSFNEQVRLWSETKAMTSDAVMADLMEFTILENERAASEARKLKLLERRKQQEQLDRLYDR